MCYGGRSRTPRVHLVHHLLEHVVELGLLRDLISSLGQLSLAEHFLARSLKLAGLWLLHVLQVVVRLIRSHILFF